MKLGFGMMRLPLEMPGQPALIDMEQTKRMVDTYLEGGGDYFDTAYMYHNGNSEDAVREAVVKRHDRGSFRLATKLPLGFFETRKDMERIFEGQFEKCGVDYFDTYLVHNVNAGNYANAQQLGAFEYLHDQKKKGRIRRFGFSYHDDADFLQNVVLRDHPEVEVVQLQVNYVDWNDSAIQSRKCVEAVRNAGHDIIVMEPQRGGLLSEPGREVQRILADVNPNLAPAEWAFRFVAEVDGVTEILSGMSCLEQVEQNVETFQNMQPLSEPEMDALDRAVEALRASVAIPCTGCDYCEGCPVNIPISRYFSLFNSYTSGKDGFSAQKMYYDNALAQGYAPAKNCVRCRRCEKHCPQHIVISDRMTEVSGRFDDK